ncbi:MAG: ABC transporter permease [Phycisphaerales bacterium]
MNRVLLVAWREFASVVFTKGFLLGILLPPLMAVVAGGAIYLMRNVEGPRVQGRLVIIDHSEIVGERARTTIPEQMDSRRAEQAAAAAKKMEELAGDLKLPKEQLDEAQRMSGSQMDMVLPRVELAIELAPSDADLDALKDSLSKTQIRARGEGADPNPLLAVAVVPQNAIVPGEDGRFGKFDLFVAPKLDIQIQRDMARGLGEAIIDARIASDPRVAAAGFTPAQLRALLQRPTVDAVTVTTSGERKSLGEFQMLIPVFFMMLMMISVMTTGQYLLTTVVEEKGSRVMEVLLSAVSPMQLMCGKILGHMTVGVLIVSIYGGAGIFGLIAFALTQIVTPMTLLLLVAYFIVASVTMAAMMAAIGSAVNELREAQTLQTPVMLLTVLPWMIWFLIQRAPNSSLATSLSFVPVMGPFVMVLRLGGSEPVPAWQHPVALVIGVATAFATLWAAAKIFRIGVLMFGKPPNFRTLARWVWMA